ncbi:MAG TPA: CopD family protein, partial [Gemmatimonadaceae bacterium]|nr:CopD family protein [Gemmatimonadaceae bacterium]
MQLNGFTYGNGAAARRVGVRAAAVATVALLILPLALFAHAHLSRSEPSAKERLTLPPKAIRLWFSERPELAFTRIQLRAADSTQVALGTVTRIANDPLGVSATIPVALAPRTYTVIWRTAAADGHATTGSFAFEVTAAETTVAAAMDTAARGPVPHALVRADSTAEESPKLNTMAATRWLEFVAMLAVVGVVVFRLVVLRLAERTMAAPLTTETRMEIADSARRLAQSALLLLLIASLSRLYEEASAVLGPNRAIDRSSLRLIVFGSSWGTGWLVGIAGIMLAAYGFAIARRARGDTGWIIAALGALAIVVSPALTGHARATSPVGLSITTDMLHVCAVCAWVGSLLALLFTALPFVRGRRTMSAIQSGPLVAGLVRAFHPVALTCATTVIATGVVASWLRLPTVASLWESTYGRVLLLKLAFVSIVVVLGALNWRRMLPALGDDRGAQRITRTAGAELTIAALVLAVTAVLV